ncbi:hypothetical protein BDY19DRAFT_467193 [Irpex rosettiformis]|uniref:Uncharacterized protein n=1 Tax=Irpex rosettiformis TaxID=378272 RepID=A0ACB8TSD3_9APHY|nr:hypothetical protein BDY19DRAFT_467193 [Irpex rosettiformis]
MRLITMILISPSTLPLLLHGPLRRDIYRTKKPVTCLSAAVVYPAMVSLAASIPTELFENILLFVGDDRQLGRCHNPRARREEMRHLSACAATCFHWAQLTRRRMFRQLALRSYEDLCGLRSLVRSSSANTRIDPIGRVLEQLVVFYRLDDHLWFHNIGGLKACGANRLFFVELHVSGPIPPTVTNARQPPLHPLFYSLPRILPMASFLKLVVVVFAENTHFPNPTLLYNLLQDCLSLSPLQLSCTNLTWDREPQTSSIPSEVDLRLAFRQDIRGGACRCTDNNLVAAMAHSVPTNRLHPSQPYLDLSDSSRLLSIIRSAIRPSAKEQDGSPWKAWFRSIPNSEIRSHVHTTLTEDSDLAFASDKGVPFYAVASRRLGGDDLSDMRRYVTHVVIDIPFSSEPVYSVKHLKTLNWDLFLYRVGLFPYLREIVIQSLMDSVQPTGREKCPATIAIVAYLLKAWPDVVRRLLVVYRYSGDGQWTRIEPDTMLEDFNRMREENKAREHFDARLAAALESELEPSDEEEDLIIDYLSSGY